MEDRAHGKRFTRAARTAAAGRSWCPGSIALDLALQWPCAGAAATALLGVIGRNARSTFDPAAGGPPRQPERSSVAVFWALRVPCLQRLAWPCGWLWAVAGRR